MATGAASGDVFTEVEGLLDRVLIFGSNVAERYLDFQAVKDQRGTAQALVALQADQANAAASVAQSQTITAALNQRTLLYLAAAGVGVVGLVLLLRR